MQEKSDTICAEYQRLLKRTAEIKQQKILLDLELSAIDAQLSSLFVCSCSHWPNPHVVCEQCENTWLFDLRGQFIQSLQPPEVDGGSKKKRRKN